MTFTNLNDLIDYYFKERLNGIALTDICPNKSEIYNLNKIPSFQEIGIWEIDYSEIRKDKELGAGNFGTVHAGKWKSSADITVNIAVKTLLENKKDEFETESTIMKNLRSQYIISLYGISQDNDGNDIMVMELMDTSLQNYIEPSNLGISGIFKTELGVENMEIALDKVKFMHIISDICAGMAYIETKNCVHRDLRTDNILIKKISNGISVKICDFGLARSLRDALYTVENPKFPVKWTAPEAFGTDGKSEFTIKSDVWSFGVLLWQVCMSGKCPFKKKTNAEVVAFVQSGGRLKKPSHCPDGIYEIAKGCWLHQPTERPTFEKISKMITEEYKEHGIYQDDSIYGVEESRNYTQLPYVAPREDPE